MSMTWTVATGAGLALALATPWVPTTFNFALIALTTVCMSAVDPIVCF